MYYQPLVRYLDPNEARQNSIIRYIGNRVLRNNKNFLCAIVGPTGVGKSYAGLKICEEYGRMFDIKFNPAIHVISSLKELLLLITAPNRHEILPYGSVLLFDEPQIEANARNWQSDVNQALNQLVSTFRNQRLVIFFAVPYLEFIDKQSRILFHGEFKVEGYDKISKITTIKPRFLEYNKNVEDFYRKRLIIKYKTNDKEVLSETKLNFWRISIASKATIDIYEDKKKKFTDDLNQRLLAKILLQEKQAQGKNKSEEFMKIKELYEQFGEDYPKILEKMPHLSPFIVDKYILYIKRGLKTRKTPTHPTQVMQNI